MSNVINTLAYLVAEIRSKYYKGGELECYPFHLLTRQSVHIGSGVDSYGTPFEDYALFNLTGHAAANEKGDPYRFQGHAYLRIVCPPAELEHPDDKWEFACPLVSDDTAHKKTKDWALHPATFPHPYRTAKPDNRLPSRTNELNSQFPHFDLMATTEFLRKLEEMEDSDIQKHYELIMGDTPAEKIMEMIKEAFVVIPTSEFGSSLMTNLTVVRGHNPWGLACLNKFARDDAKFDEKGDWTGEPQLLSTHPPEVLRRLNKMVRDADDKVADKRKIKGIPKPRLPDTRHLPPDTRLAKRTLKRCPPIKLESLDFAAMDVDLEPYVQCLTNAKRTATDLFKRLLSPTKTLIDDSSIASSARSSTPDIAPYDQSLELIYPLKHSPSPHVERDPRSPRLVAQTKGDALSRKRSPKREGAEDFYWIRRYPRANKRKDTDYVFVDKDAGHTSPSMPALEVVKEEELEFARDEDVEMTDLTSGKQSFIRLDSDSDSDYLTDSSSPDNSSLTRLSKVSPSIPYVELSIISPFFAAFSIMMECLHEEHGRKVPKFPPSISPSIYTNGDDTLAWSGVVEDPSSLITSLPPFYSNNKVAEGLISRPDQSIYAYILNRLFSQLYWLEGEPLFAIAMFKQLGEQLKPFMGNYKRFWAFKDAPRPENHLARMANVGPVFSVAE